MENALRTAEAQRAKSYDESAVHQICTFMLGCSSTMRLPDQARDEGVCSALFKAREVLLGSRTAKWTDAIVKPSGELDWSAHGVHKLVWNEDNTAVTEVIHRPTTDSAAVPRRAPIDRNCCLQADFSETEAFVVFGRSATSCPFSSPGMRGPFAIRFKMQWVRT